MASLPSSPASRQQRIRRVSRFFRWLSLLVGLQSVVLAACAFLVPVVAVEPTYASPGTRPTVEPAPEVFSGARWYLVTAGTVPSYRVFTWDVRAAGSGIREGREWMARGAAVLWNAYLLLGALLGYRLFRGYERGEIFARVGVRGLKALGAWMMGFWGVGMLFQASSLWWGESMNLRFDLGVGILPGLFVFLIGWILEEAHQIAEEQALTV